MHRFRLAALLALVLSACAAPATSQPTSTPRPTDAPTLAATDAPTDPPPTVEPSPTADPASQWREDLQALVAFIHETHPLPYVRTSQTDFEAAVADLEARLPYYAERHVVKPGITGWAQINYPYGASIEDAREKLQLDLYYAKNYSPFLDVLILLQTVRVVLWPEGAGAR